MDEPGISARAAHGRLAALALLAALWTGGAGAQEEAAPKETAEADAQRRYSVELILFAYAEDVGSGSEIFLPDEPAPADASGPYDAPFGGSGNDPSAFPGDPFDESAIPEFGDTVMRDADEASDDEPLDEELAEILGTAVLELEIMPPEARTMAGAWERLRNLDAYRPVMWTGWTQTVFEEAATPAIDIRRLGRLPLDFAGELKLYLSRYLHLVVDLTMEERPATADRPAGPDYGDARNRGLQPIDRYGRPVAGAPAVIRYTISEDRIMRDGEIRYYDHPRFGLIAKVLRVDLPEEPEPSLPTPNTDILLPPEPAPR